MLSEFSQSSEYCSLMNLFSILLCQAFSNLAVQRWQLISLLLLWVLNLPPGNRIAHGKTSKQTHKSLFVFKVLKAFEVVLCVSRCNTQIQQGKLSLRYTQKRCPITSQSRKLLGDGPPPATAAKITFSLIIVTVFKYLITARALNFSGFAC